MREREASLPVHPLLRRKQNSRVSPRIAARFTNSPLGGSPETQGHTLHPACALVVPGSSIQADANATRMTGRETKSEGGGNEEEARKERGIISVKEEPQDGGQCTVVSSDRKGLSSLIAKYFGKPLDKSQQLSDWERRPLRVDQVRYAGIIVFFLRCDTAVGLSMLSLIYYYRYHGLHWYNKMLPKPVQSYI